MNGTYIAQEWSVHAQFTLRRPPVTVTVPTAHVWTGNNNARPCYGFQRGNITFTTRPPSRNSAPSNLQQPPVRDSGYSSEPGDRRRCRSSCSFVLETPETKTTTNVPRRHTTHFCTRVAAKTGRPPSRKDVASQTGPAITPAPSVPSPLPDDEETPNRRNPRTVHIDVYCTDSGEDVSSPDRSEASSIASGRTSSSAPVSRWSTTSSPQTVFESDALRIVHRRPESGKLPRAFFRPNIPLASSPSQKINRPTILDLSGASVPSIAKSQDDGSLYPSQSSETTVPTDARYASRDPSWSTFPSSTSGASSPASSTEESSSSYALFDEEYDSAAASSWKETEVESLAQSGLSLARTDSFAYAEPADKLRIREKARVWDKETNPMSDSSSSPCLTRVNTIRRRPLVEPSSSDLPSAHTPASEIDPCASAFSRAALLFGRMRPGLRRPGHHEGPARNPLCGCPHCRRQDKQMSRPTCTPRRPPSGGSLSGTSV